VTQSKTNTLRMWLLNTGFCTASEHQVIQGGEHKTIKTHALAVLFEHPREGWVLFDTGYAPRVQQGFQTFPFQLYAMLTPVTMRNEWTVAAQLEQLDIKPDDVKTIIISHFHADHIGGLLDFPNSRIICFNDAFLDVRERKGFAALKRAFLPSLMPVHFNNFDCFSHFDNDSLEFFGPTRDIFGDGLLRLVNLPGHARGQIGVYAQTEIGFVLLAADGAWLSRSVRENRSGSPLAMRLAGGNVRATIDTLDKLHRFHHANKDVWVLPTHCSEVAAMVTLGKPQAIRERS
jgi:glyoxylase-like metal-dependent hydrolase (beta-lactamase superfamily II)